MRVMCVCACVRVCVCMYVFRYRVIHGFETLDDLEKVPVDEKTYRPKTEIRIRRVTIHANPIADDAEQ